jgi:hypothetical protein
MKARKAAGLFLILALILAGAPSLMARGLRHARPDQSNKPGATNMSEEQYETGLEALCAQQEDERALAQASKKIAYFSEECLPIEVANRRSKRMGEKKHLTTCDAIRKEQRAHAQKKERFRLSSSCFNLIPDVAMEIEVDEPLDPIYQHPPGGIWKEVKFFGCAKGEACKPLPRLTTAN